MVPRRRLGMPVSPQPLLQHSFARIFPNAGGQWAPLGLHSACLLPFVGPWAYSALFGVPATVIGSKQSPLNPRRVPWLQGEVWLVSLTPRRDTVPQGEAHSRYNHLNPLGSNLKTWGPFWKPGVYFKSSRSHFGDPRSHLGNARSAFRNLASTL